MKSVNQLLNHSCSAFPVPHQQVVAVSTFTTTLGLAGRNWQPGVHVRIKCLGNQQFQTCRTSAGQPPSALDQARVQFPENKSIQNVQSHHYQPGRQPIRPGALVLSQLHCIEPADPNKKTNQNLSKASTNIAQTCKCLQTTPYLKPVRWFFSLW